MPPTQVQQAFQLALQHHQGGRLPEAEALYREILTVDPRHADARHLLGVIAHQVGRSDAAVELIQEALRLAPASPTFHCNLGEAYRALRQFDRAIAAFRRALELQPGVVEAQYNLGNALRDAGRLDEAIEAFRAATLLQPGLVDAHTNLGAALHARGHPDEAIAAYRQALELQPDKAQAHHNLGSALKDRGEVPEAIAAYRRALELDSQLAGVHYNLGGALGAQDRFEEEIAAYRRAIELDPTFAPAYNNLGNALKNENRFEEALAAYRRSLELQPDAAATRSNLLLSLQYLPGQDAEAIFREHCRWDEIHGRPLASFIAPHTHDPQPDRRLRIGYVSPDFRSHSVAFFLEKLLAGHDPEVVEITCYADLPRADAVTERLRKYAAHWRKITGLGDGLVAEMIRRDGIDILVDLAGHTSGNRLLVFARKPAPVQVTYLGYGDTTGLRTMDYRITDAVADPPGTSEHLHSERLIRLPEIFACFRPSPEAPPVAPPPATTRGQVTLASFHTPAKLNDEVLALWATLLRGAPAARLMLVARGFDEGSRRERFRARFEQLGIGAARLDFRGAVPFPEYLALHGEVDLLLDSHPFSGHTVGCHALWMGVPVVTLAGARHCSRMIASALTNVGLPELVAHSAEQYVEIAGALACDQPRLAALRSALRERLAASPLTDGARFARHVEHAYREMWQAWCHGAARGGESR